jgi:hypothetical protein
MRRGNTLRDRSPPGFYPYNLLLTNVPVSGSFVRSRAGRILAGGAEIEFDILRKSGRAPRPKQPRMSTPIPIANLGTRVIRAVYDARTIRVYQAFSHEIADAALASNTFTSPPFKMDRMTWIKPSFLWMMYRSGWGQKDAGQERILAIDLRRVTFGWMLDRACLSHAPAGVAHADWQSALRSSPVRVQWDPDRDLLLRPLARRAIQIGLRGEAVARYVREGIVSVTDVTTLAHRIHALVQSNRLTDATALLPKELPYPISLSSALADV